MCEDTLDAPIGLLVPLQGRATIKRERVRCLGSAGAVPVQGPAPTGGVGRTWHRTGAPIPTWIGSKEFRSRAFKPHGNEVN
jgi:hypothetical protein